MPCNDVELSMTATLLFDPAIRREIVDHGPGLSRRLANF